MGSCRVSMPQTPRDKIKSIVSIHRAAFHAYLEHDTHPPITKLKKKDPDPPEIAQEYTIIMNVKAKAESGLSAFPPGTSPAMYTSVLKWEMCDFAVQTFIASLKKQLDLRVPGTKVDWITLSVNARIKFRLEKPTKDEEPRHSLFLITMPDADEETEFVADFTVEQFGYSGDGWFMEKGEYLDNVAATREYSVRDVEEEIRQSDEAEWWEAAEKEGMARLTIICDELRWGEVIEMAPDVRVGFMYKLYEYSEYLVSGRMSMEDLHKICSASHTDAEVVIPHDD